MDRSTVKSSTIFVAEGNQIQVFRSLDEMPTELRGRLEKSTNGMHSATILIADRRGRDEIARALNGLPTDFQSKAAALVSGRRKAAQLGSVYAETIRRISLSNWMLYGVPAAVGVAIWLLFQIR